MLWNPANLNGLYGFNQSWWIRVCADRVALCTAGASFTNHPCFLNCTHPTPVHAPWGACSPRQGSSSSREPSGIRVKNSEVWRVMKASPIFKNKAHSGAALLVQIIWGYTSSYGKRRNPAFSFCHHTLPWFSVWRNSLIDDSVTDQLGPYRWPWVPWHYWKNSTAWRLQTENSFSLSDPSPPV